MFDIFHNKLLIKLDTHTHMHICKCMRKVLKGQYNHTPKYVQMFILTTNMYNVHGELVKVGNGWHFGFCLIKFHIV